MSSLLSNLVVNLSGRLHSNKCTNCKSFIEYNSIEYRNVNQKHKKHFDKDLIKRFANI